LGKSKRLVFEVNAYGLNRIASVAKIIDTITNDAKHVAVFMKRYAWTRSWAPRPKQAHARIEG